MKVVLDSFKEGESIPVKFTCDGENLSPSIRWETINGAKSYAIIMEDPDAPRRTFVHWVIYNITSNSLPEGVPKREKTDYGLQGVNDFNEIGYGGPCPPRTHPYHRYYFNVYAINSIFNEKSGLTAEELREMIISKIIDSGKYMGKYKRL
ncbi:hypothetical protein HS7_19690 [Sulfolobales archaeon HS-7]|nr:hypothetical protein HS7_19690 [Sulfolobales archaeon HS-7]